MNVTDWLITVPFLVVLLVVFVLVVAGFLFVRPVTERADRELDELMGDLDMPLSSCPHPRSKPSHRPPPPPTPPANDGSLNSLTNTAAMATAFSGSSSSGGPCGGSSGMSSGGGMDSGGMC